VKDILTSELLGSEAANGGMTPPWLGMSEGYSYFGAYYLLGEA